MKRTTGLILLLALLIGTCTAFAKGEIERYQREKLDKLATPLAYWLRVALSTIRDDGEPCRRVEPDPNGSKGRAVTRLLVERHIVELALPLPPQPHRRMSVRGREIQHTGRYALIRSNLLSDLMWVESGIPLHDGDLWVWGAPVVHYNEECIRQLAFREKTRAILKLAVKRCHEEPDASIGDFTWEMKYDGVTEWYELNENDIIKILRQLRADGWFQNDVESIQEDKIYKRVMWDGLKNLLLARKNIEVIDLSGSGLTNEIARQLINALDENHVVQRIDVSGNDLSAELVAAFQSIVDRNIHTHNDMSSLSLAITQNSASEYDAFLAMEQNSASDATSLHTLVAQSQANADGLAAVAAHPDVDTALLRDIVERSDIDVAGLQSCAIHPLVTADIFATIAAHPNVDVDLLGYIAKHPNADADTLLAVVHNPITNLNVLNDVVQNPNANVDAALLATINSRQAQLDAAGNGFDLAALNPNTTNTTVVDHDAVPAAVREQLTRHPTNVESFANMGGSR